MDKNVYFASGRRKGAVARVWLQEGDKGFEVNARPFENYFTRETHRVRIQEPLKASNLLERFKVRAHVKGGGLTGQAEAIQLGIARALLTRDQNLRSLLRKNGFLTRDPRVKERKKYGRKGARRSFQYTKR